MFDTLIKDAQIFLRALAKDNTRDWFQAHKSDYDAKLRDPAKALLDEMAPRLHTLTGYTVTPKLFRAHRDVRFSKDKTPYKTHLHMLWAVASGARQNPVLFLGINQTEVTVGTGMMEFTKDVLLDWRKMVDLDGDHIAHQIAKVTRAGFAQWDPKLKRIPAPFDKDHPHGDLLRQKGLVATGQLSGEGEGEGEGEGDLVAPLQEAFKTLWPLSDMLIGVAETPTL